MTDQTNERKPINGDGQVVTPPPETEAKARKMGWVPQEQWRGDDGVPWLDAQSFVEKAESVLPILRSTNRNLEGKVSNLNTELSSTKTALAEAQEQIAALKEFTDDIVKQRVEAARKELAAELKSVRADGNTEREVEIMAELAKPEPVKETPKREAAPKPAAETPEFKAWKAQNPWWENDPIKRAVATQMGIKLAEEGKLKDLTPTERANLITAETNAYLKQGDDPPPQQVGGGRNGSSGGGGKSYADLPDDAKAACDRFGKRLVGPNREFKTMEAWRAHYVKQVLA